MPAPACTYVVLTCMDFRIVEPLRRFLDAEGISGDADLLSWPGGAACLVLDDERNRVTAAVRLAAELHGCDEAVLVMHEDCRRLGGSAAFTDAAVEDAAIRDYLRRAADAIRSAVPSLTPRSVVVRLSGEIEEVR